MCAAQELNFVKSKNGIFSLDEFLFSDPSNKSNLIDIINDLLFKNYLMNSPKSDGYTNHPFYKSPALTTNIRVIDIHTFKVINESTNVIIDQIGYSRAFFSLYPGIN